MHEGFKGLWVSRKAILELGLKPIEQYVLTEIFQLTRGGKDCYATNAHFAEICGVERGRIGRIIRKLRDLGYVRVEEASNLAQRHLFCTVDLGDVPQRLAVGVRREVAGVPPIEIHPDQDIPF